VFERYHHFKANARVQSGPLNASLSAPGGRQIVGQVPNLTSESACKLPYADHSSIAICVFTKPQRVEG